MTQGDGRLYAYDAFNRLVEVRDDQGICISRFKYDVHGRRVAKIDQPDGLNPVTTRFIYDGDNEIEELVNGSLSFTNLCGEMIDDVIARKNHSTGVWHYFHKDALWNVTALTDALGAVAERYEYSPFGIAKILDANFQEIQVGGQSVKSSQLENPYLFLSRRWEEDTGLYFFRARYYDPVRGRFVQRDPENDALNHGNLYTYASHNPLVYTDPWGKEGLWASFVGAVKAGINAVNSFINSVNPAKIASAFGKGLMAGLKEGLGDLIDFSLPNPMDLLRLIADWMLNGSANAKDLLKKAQNMSFEDWAESLGKFLGKQIIERGVDFLTGGAGLLATIAKRVKNAAKGMDTAKDVSKLAKRVDGKVPGGRKNSSRDTRKHSEGSQCSPGKGCFVAGTLILLAGGDFRPIEEVRVGERVAVAEEAADRVEQGGNLTYAWTILEIASKIL
jgi:RHS repeat-associated protein